MFLRYTPAEDCIDIDECLYNLDNCDINASCNNTAGSFECHCNSGYEMDGNNTCINIDECTTGWYHGKETYHVKYRYYLLKNILRALKIFPVGIKLKKYFRRINFVTTYHTAYVQDFHTDICYDKN